jgi:hypothetical protein
MHLDTATAVGMEQAHAVLAGNGRGLIQTSAIHDDYFQDTRQTGEHVECRTQGAGLVERRNND